MSLKLKERTVSNKRYRSQLAADRPVRYLQAWSASKGLYRETTPVKWSERDLNPRWEDLNQPTVAPKISLVWLLFGYRDPPRVWNPDPVKNKKTLNILPCVRPHPLFINPIKDKRQNSQPLAIKKFYLFLLAKSSKRSRKLSYQQCRQLRNK